MNKKYLSVLLVVFLFFSLCMFACSDERDNTTPSSKESTDTQESDTSTKSSDTGSSKNDNEEDNKEDNDPIPDEENEEYFVASIIENENVVANPYTSSIEVSDELKFIYYSASTPGGEPKNDGTGNIWLTLKPLKDNCIDKVEVIGSYSSIENEGDDIYCIYGVSSNLTVSISTKQLPSVQKEIFDGYGYGIFDDGMMTVTWKENPQDPIRYVELSYFDGRSRIEYIDASKGSKELFLMEEHKQYTVSMRAIGYSGKGQMVDVKGCYMKSPKEVPFPRVEITTENYIWPDCDFVQSPEGCWGAGITNAEYEQCVITLYNEQNEVVYSSSLDNERPNFLGAKMKIRGNTSARYATDSRYPYKIKLNKKADLLFPLIDREEKECYKDKDWLLLNYGNEGFRIFGDAIADAVGTEWSPDYCYVSLYINGEYRGLYVLSESVKEGNKEGNEQSRVNVEKDGYVFECDAYWWNEELSFSTPLTQNTPMHFTFKYPDSDDINADSKELIYLKNYLTEFEEALMRDDDSYLDYIDLDSFVKWLLVSDFLCISDGGGCNIFLCKEDSTDNTKLEMGPNWDFDSYMGNVYGLSTIRLKWDTAPFYYQHLIEKESFQKRYSELFWELKDALYENIEKELDKINEESHTSLLQYDNFRFGSSFKTLSERKDKFITWLGEHIRWMENQF